MRPTAAGGFCNWPREASISGTGFSWHSPNVIIYHHLTERAGQWGMSVEHFILEAEKSSELVAALRLLTEAEDGGQSRFPPETCRAVAKAIVCRTYASASYELCHLVRAVSDFQGGYVDFFWMQGPLRTSRFRGHLSSPTSAPNHFKAVGNGIDVLYRDKTFSIAFSRMPFLAALAEFLVTALGFASLDDILSPLSRPVVTTSDVSNQANALSRAVYDWLKDHLPPLQAQRKLGMVIDFIKDRNDGDFDPLAINDDAVLAFWREAAMAGDVDDFRTFTSAFLAFGRLRQVMENADAIRAIDQAAPIGTSREDGEVDPHEVESLVDSVVETSNPIDDLALEPTSLVKFFNTKERSACRFLFDCGRIADQLPLSFVRAEVFGAAQSRVTQGLRTGMAGNALVALIEASCVTNYLGYQKTLSALADHGRNVLLASAHMMHSAGMVSFPDDTTALPFQKKSAPVPSIENGGTVAILDEARRAAKGFSRQGFRPADLTDEAVREGYMTGVPLVAKVTGRLEEFIGLLSRIRLPSGDWEAQFGSDKPEFTAHFRAIYGDAT